MLDLIIPVYNNKIGLYRTLMSIGLQNTIDLFVTIVDDASTNCTYNDIITWYAQFHPIQLLTLPQNSGPGVARQYGLNHTKEPYVAFIDCGDTFVTPTSLATELHFLLENPEIYVASYAHYECYSDDEYYFSLVSPSHNRMHGKMYLRSFLSKYNITFCESSSYVNEDIGFNIACRLITEHLSRHDNIIHYAEHDEPIVYWTACDNSLVRTNNCQFYYKEQNLGMAKTVEYALNIARNNQVDTDILVKEIYASFMHTYFYYLSTINRRPEFAAEALIGARYFYHNIAKTWLNYDNNLLTKVYYDTLSTFLSDPQDPLRDKLLPLDLVSFIELLNSNN